MYHLRTGRGESDGFFNKDNYGVSTLLLSRGRNPVAYLNEYELKTLLSGLATLFDTLVLDVGSCYRSENLKVISGADSVILLEIGRRLADIESITDLDFNKVIKIKLNGDGEEAVAIDDAVKRIYGIEEDEKIESRNDRKIRGRN